MTAIILKAETRQPGASKNAETKNKKIPAVVYGPKSANQNIAIEAKDFEKALNEAGESTLVDLIVAEQQPIKVLVHDTQRDPVSGNYIHVDFYQLDMTKKTKVDVELKFVGTEEIMKLTGGEISESVDSLEIECLPKDLIKEITVDLSALKNIGDVLYAKDVPLPQGLTLISDPELPVASLMAIVEEKIETAPASEETAAPMTEKEAKAKEQEETTGENN